MDANLIKYLEDVKNCDIEDIAEAYKATRDALAKELPEVCLMAKEYIVKYRLTMQCPSLEQEYARLFTLLRQLDIKKERDQIRQHFVDITGIFGSIDNQLDNADITDNLPLFERLHVQYLYNDGLVLAIKITAVLTRFEVLDKLTGGKK